MNPRRKSILSMLDDTVRWTGMPARVAEQISGDPDRRQWGSIWIPIWSIVFACAVLGLFVAWPPLLGEMSLALVVSFIVPFWGGIFAMMAGVHASGPLGKSSLGDDERESALRKDSFLFCLGALAVLNGLAQPCFMILSSWQDWQLVQTASVVMSTIMLNVTLLWCLPTLYASAKLGPLPTE